jgi:O-acetyl-ADP-ribose deacetylase (regulator of RNase III)
MQVLHGNMLEEVTQGVILQQVNAQGVMGSGIAKAIRDKWPRVWDEYNAWYLANDLVTRRLGTTWLLGKSQLVEVEDGLFVANIVGQNQFYRQGEPRGTRFTSYDAIDKALTDLSEVLQGLPVSLHFPLLGSDRGGGHWPIVKEIIKHRLSGFEQTLWLLPGVQEPA